MIIGITGTDGAGKGAVVQLLVQEFGFVHYSARDFITAEINKRGLTADRSTMRLVANDLRRNLGNDAIVQKALERVALEAPVNVVIESIRALAEVTTLKAAGGVLLAVDAPVVVRYQRITGRGSTSDNISYETFLENEAIEMNDHDPNGMQKAAVMAAADHAIVNDQDLAYLSEVVHVWYNSLS